MACIDKILVNSVLSVLYFYRMSVQKYPTSPMLGRREIVDGKVKFCLPIKSCVLEIFLTLVDHFWILTDLNAHFFFVTL